MESQNNVPLGELAGVFEGVIRAFEKVIASYQYSTNISRQREQKAKQMLAKLEDHGEDIARES